MQRFPDQKKYIPKWSSWSRDYKKIVSPKYWASAIGWLIYQCPTCGPTITVSNPKILYKSEMFRETRFLTMSIVFFHVAALENHLYLLRQNISDFKRLTLINGTFENVEFNRCHMFKTYPYLDSPDLTFLMNYTKNTHLFNNMVWSFWESYTLLYSWVLTVGFPPMKPES